MNDENDFNDIDMRDDIEVFSDIIAEVMDESDDPELAAITIISSERFQSLLNTAYGEGLKAGLEASE